MKIKNIGLSERPRERLINLGVNSLSDAEILAIILQSGNREMSAIELANFLLEKYGVDKLFTISFDELTSNLGIKAAKASKILCAFELARRSLRINNNNTIFKNSLQAYNFLRADFMFQKLEVCYIILLDTKCKYIKKIKISDGDTNRVEVPFKKIVRLLFNYEAAGIILAHNHPSGDFLPSRNDKQITLKLTKILNELDFFLFDHLIFGIDNYFSFADNNLLEELY